MGDLKEFAGKIGFVAVSEMPAVAEIHRQNLVARLEEREIYRHVCAAAAVWLDIRVLGAEEFSSAVDRQLLGGVHVFTTAIPALARVAFGVFVGQHRTLRLH